MSKSTILQDKTLDLNIHDSVVFTYECVGIGVSEVVTVAREQDGQTVNQF